MKYCLLSLILLLGFTACTDPHALPEQRPADFSFTWARRGGISPDFESITVREQGCQWEARHAGNPYAGSFRISPADLDTLYKVLYENQFTQINTVGEGEADSAIGSTLTVAWGTEKHVVENSGALYVGADHKAHYMNILEQVQFLRDQAMRQLSRPCTLQIQAADTSLLSLHLTCFGLSTHWDAAALRTPARQTLNLPFGQHVLNYRIGLPDGTERQWLDSIQVGQEGGLWIWEARQGQLQRVPAPAP